jgi:hypothetical protein
MMPFWLLPDTGKRSTDQHLSCRNNDYETGRYWHHRKQFTPNVITQDQNYSEELWNRAIKQLDKVKSTSPVA